MSLAMYVLHLLLLPFLAPVDSSIFNQMIWTGDIYQMLINSNYRAVQEENTTHAYIHVVLGFEFLKDDTI